MTGHFHNPQLDGSCRVHLSRKQGLLSPGSHNFTVRTAPRTLSPGLGTPKGPGPGPGSQQCGAMDRASGPTQQDAGVPGRLSPPSPTELSSSKDERGAFPRGIQVPTGTEMSGGLCQCSHGRPLFEYGTCCYRYQLPIWMHCSSVLCCGGEAASTMPRASSCLSWACAEIMLGHCEQRPSSMWRHRRKIPTLAFPEQPQEPGPKKASATVHSESGHRSVWLS